MATIDEKSIHAIHNAWLASEWKNSIPRRYLAYHNGRWFVTSQDGGTVLHFVGANGLIYAVTRSKVREDHVPLPNTTPQLFLPIYVIPGPGDLHVINCRRAKFNIRDNFVIQTLAPIVDLH